MLIVTCNEIDKVLETDTSLPTEKEVTEIALYHWICSQNSSHKENIVVIGFISEVTKNSNI